MKPNAPLNPKSDAIGTRFQLESLAMSAVARSFETLSFDACRVAGGWFGLACYALLKKRRAIALENVQLALDVSPARARQIARRASLNFGMTFAEFMHLRVASAEEVRERASILGIEHIDEGFARGKGVILLTAHVGNWELMGARAAQEFPLAVVARPTSNGGVQSRIDASRAAHGLKSISSWDSGRGPLQVLRENGSLGVLCDQYAVEQGVLMPFFDQPTKLYTAPARLATMSGALIVPAFGVRRTPWLRDGRIEAHVFPGFEVRKGRDREAAILEGTKRMKWEYERIIRRHPDQWLWIHRRWRREDGADVSR